MLRCVTKQTQTIFELFVGTGEIVGDGCIKHVYFIVLKLQPYC